MTRMMTAAKPILMTAVMLISSFAGCLGDDAVDEPETPDVTPPMDVTLTADVDGRDATMIPSVVGGLAPYTYAWMVDGVATQPEGLVLVLTDLEAATYTVTYTVTDAEGSSATRDVIFTIEQWNRAPTASLDLPSAAYVGDDVAWTLTTSDEDDDVLALNVWFDDGGYSDASEGVHVWLTADTYTVTATVTDADGARVEVSETILVTTNMAPTLSVTMDPASDSDVILTTDDMITLTIDAADPEGQVVTVRVHWDDGVGEDLVGDTVTHSFALAGMHSISVIATDDRGQQTTWSDSIEVVEELTDTAVYAYFEQQVPEDDSVEDKLDEDGDGEVDGSEDALDEDGYDWQDDFDSDADGESDHDEGGVNDWQHKNEGNIHDVAASNDTSGGARDSHDEDPLTDEEIHVTDEETDSELDDEGGLSGQGDVMEDLFSDTGDDQENASEQDAFEPEYYEDLLNGTHALRWNETWTADLDNNGNIDTNCIRVTVVIWVDADHDQNPERAMMYRMRYCVSDFDGDGVNDLITAEIEGLNATDHDDNGTPEIIEALHLVTSTWLNGTATDTNVWLLAAVVVDMDEDGNAEFAALAAATIRTVDLNSDGTNEASHIRYGVMAIRDHNDDGQPENGIILLHEAVAWDLDGDGNVNRQMNHGRIIHMQDRDSDGNLDRMRAAAFGEQKWDNNSDGTIDGRQSGWLGVGYTDRDLDGDFDKVAMAYGVKNEWTGPNGGKHKESFFLASTVEDDDADGNLNRVAWIAHSSEGHDLDDDGLWESMTEMAAGAEALDHDDDGNWDRYTGVRVYVQKSGEHAHGWSQEVMTIWIVRVWDLNGNGVADMLHAVNVFTVHWDNNSDGGWDTEYTEGTSFYALDANEDGHAERLVFAHIVHAVSDDDGDGNLEWTSDEVLIHSRNTTANGTVTHAWVLYYKVVKTNVSSSGIAQSENTTALAYETWNTPHRQETHAIHYSSIKYDWDRDGVVDSETTHIAEDNRS